MKEEEEGNTARNKETEIMRFVLSRESLWIIEAPSVGGEVEQHFPPHELNLVHNKNNIIRNTPGSSEINEAFNN